MGNLTLQRVKFFVCFCVPTNKNALLLESFSFLHVQQCFRRDKAMESDQVGEAHHVGDEQLYESMLSDLFSFRSVGWWAANCSFTVWRPEPRGPGASAAPGTASAKPNAIGASAAYAARSTGTACTAGAVY